MSNFINNQRGFTLIEVMVAMAIFVIFLGALLTSYTSIVRGQQEANDYRVLYSEAREVFENMVNTLRNSYVVSANPNQGILTVFVHGKGEFVSYKLMDSGLRVVEANDSGAKLKEFTLNADTVEVSQFKFTYKEEGQPSVRLMVEFKRDPFILPLQTTISSRWYGELPVVDPPYTPVFQGPTL